jgi:DNA topoisomerase-2
MYAGSPNMQLVWRWVLQQLGKRMVFKEIAYVGVVLKMFDEIVVNARDHSIDEANKVTQINVEVDAATGCFVVHNTGFGFPVKKHPETGLYIADMMLGHLRTSTNYDDDTRRVTGGMNGLGAKIANIMSTEFTVTSADPAGRKFFSTTWRNNMSEADEAVIESCSVKEAKEIGTRVTWTPDYVRFDMTPRLSADFIALLRKRVVDLAVTTSKKVTVSFNGEEIRMRNFENYVAAYVGDKKQEHPRVYRKFNERWQVCAVFVPDDEYRCVSFVNGIDTYLGGEHETYVTNQVVRKLTAKLREKSKVDVKPAYIRMKLWIFINAVIENPTFDSQSKGSLTLPVKDFGSTCDIDDDFIARLAKTGLVSAVEKYAEHQAGQKLVKTDGSKKARVNIPNLHDATKAGTRESRVCYLFLTEGQSAAATALSGVPSAGGREYFGVFPLKGKPLNVREATTKQQVENVEIAALKLALGLQEGRHYDDAEDLRYGHLIIFADADNDGYHIIALIFNWLHYSFPSLLRIPGFLQFFRTPIIKAVGKGVCAAKKDPIEFYTLSDFRCWKDDPKVQVDKWAIKYYKGLGTSTAKEAKGYFQRLDQHLLPFRWVDDDDAGETKHPGGSRRTPDDAITLAFAKDRAADRKEWLCQYQEDAAWDVDPNGVRYQDFVDKQLIVFSMADNRRSLPGFDGLKPSQRKVLYSARMRLVDKEMKVAQFAGIASGDSGYPHGEASLMGVIVNLAQDFVGSHNVNYLQPNGQFGSRLLAGKDAASPRYIFTKLGEVTRTIFDPRDDQLLEHMDDDGLAVEPRTYYPVIPMILVNGAEGIGTGYSTSIPQHDPKDVVANVRRLIAKPTADIRPMLPWYSGAQGRVVASDDGRSFMCHGCWSRDSPTSVEITDLPPVGKTKATQEYVNFLDKHLMTNSKDTDSTHWVADYVNASTDYLVRFQVFFPNKAVLDDLLADSDAFEKQMKLQQAIRTTNMHAFDIESRIVKHDSIGDILRDYMPVRLRKYVERKTYLEAQLRETIAVLQAKIRFLRDVTNNDLTLVSRCRKKVDVEVDMHSMDYHRVDGGFDYLLHMPITSFTAEKVAELDTKHTALSADIAALDASTPESLWSADLDAFEAAYDKLLAARKQMVDYDLGMEASRAAAQASKPKKTRKPRKGRKT